MKTQKKVMIVFIIIISVFFTYFTPMVSAVERLGPDDQNQNKTGNLSGNQERGPENNNNQMSPGANQTEGKNQSGLGRPGYGNENNTAGSQYRYQYQRRYINIDGEGNFTRIRSQYRNNNTEEHFEIFFNIDDAPTLKLLYNATTNIHHFNLVIDQLVEYNDINKNGKYDDSDIVVSNLLFSNVTFSNITYTNSTTPEGQTITILETHTLDNLFSIVIYVASEQTSLLNYIITPEEIKIDFNIIGYPFVNQTSQLALINRIETPFCITSELSTYDEKQGRANQESGLNISSGSHRGFFSWANSAIIDNTSRPVNVTVLIETEQTFTRNTQETITQSRVIFSYPRGEIISHDPKVGVLDILQEIIPSVLQFEYLSAIYLITCVISAIIFYGIIRYRKKQ